MENGGHNEVPEDANEHCPGPQSESAGKSDACEGCPNQEVCATAPKGPDPDLVAIAERMATVKHKILVLSGKGGVGKSTFSAQLSYALAAKDFQVGLLDIDICGPSIPKMLGLEGQEIHQSNLGWSPVYVESNLGVMSIGFMLPDPDEAVIWRGPRKNGIIKQFLKDVYWGELDFLIVDAPPGTSDEHISIVQFLQATGIDGAIIVTTPQQVSLIDVRKEVSFCKKVGLNVLGVVENMSGLCQPLTDMKFLSTADSGEQRDITEWVMASLREKAPEMLNLVAFTEVFDSSGGGAEKMCHDMKMFLSTSSPPSLPLFSRNSNYQFNNSPLTNIQPTLPKQSRFYALSSSSSPHSILVHPPNDVVYQPTDFNSLSIGTPISPAVVSLPKWTPKDQASFLISFIVCTASVSFTSLVFAAVPTITAMGRAAISLSKLADTATEELPSTMAAVRLSGMEISDLTLELSDLSHEISDGVSKSAQAVQAAEAGLRQIGSRARQQTISMIQERASLPPISIQPVVAGAAKKTSHAVIQATKSIVDMISHGEKKGADGNTVNKKDT